MVLAEVDAYARRQARPRRRVASPTCARHARATAPQALDDLPLLAVALREDGIDAPAVAGLADVVAGRVEPERWARRRDRAARRAGGTRGARAAAE